MERETAMTFWFDVINVVITAASVAGAGWLLVRLVREAKADLA